MVSSGADVHESSLKTPRFGVGERQMAKVVTSPPSTNLSTRIPQALPRAGDSRGQSDPWGAQLP